MGNLHSVHSQCKKLSSNVSVSSNYSDIMNADKLILPGVGHFAKGMEKLSSMALIEIISERVLVHKVPILGICLGMQLLSKFSEEGNVDGLGWIDSKTVEFNISNNRFKVPHMGWNSLCYIPDSDIFNGINENDEFYFVHSYHLSSSHKNMIIGKTNYFYDFISTVEKENIFGVQFHPEKSHEAGITVLKNFLRNI
tara:strand:+ start:148 stop:735 length:588 start_codon:yes stop_codon:yes gene_type:complete